MKSIVIDVIGGSGFIGTSLATRLRGLNIDFNILDIEAPMFENAPFKFADVRSFSSLSDSISRSSIIINLAAIHRDDVHPTSLYFETNVDGAEKICMAAEDKSIEHIIFTSSVAVYGQNLGIVSEDNLPSPSNHYGKSKLQAEEVFIRWQMRDPSKRKLTIIRPTVIFGPSNRGNFYNLIHQIFKNNFLMIGCGENKKSIAYVENLVDFILYSINFSPGIHVYNYVDEPDLSMNELIRLIYHSIGYHRKSLFRIPYSVGYSMGMIFDVFSSLVGRRLPISRVRVKKFCSDSSFSTKAIDIGFKPRFSLVEAVRKTVKYEYEKFLGNKK